MKVVVFGATGMVGRGALLECLADPAVARVVAVVRRPLALAGRTGQEKLVELLHDDFSDFASLADELTGVDACLYCLGKSSAGMTEVDYTRVTYTFALAAAKALLAASPGVRFVFVSGAGTDSTEQGRAMWARVKGKTENALLALPFTKPPVMVRPGYIQPVGGARATEPWLRALYAVVGPLYPLWRALFPKAVTTSAELGRRMLYVAKQGAPKAILEAHDLAALDAAVGPKQVARPTA